MNIIIIEDTVLFAKQQCLLSWSPASFHIRGLGKELMNQSGHISQAQRVHHELIVDAITQLMVLVAFKPPHGQVLM